MGFSVKLNLSRQRVNRLPLWKHHKNILPQEWRAYNEQAVKVSCCTLFVLQAVLPENRTKAYKPYNPLPHAALGLYGFLYVYGIEMTDFKYPHEIVVNT